MLASAIGGSGATTQGTKAATGGINSILTGTTDFTNLINSHTTNNFTDRPKAFLNVVFFDERFNFVEEGSTKIRVATAGNHVTPIVLSNIKVPKNGYCFVYVSNESPSNVFFDDLQVRHDRGRIIEENHYYAYGLRIFALSSRAFGGMPNAFQYQGDYSEFDDDLGWNDFMLRSYDPQLGRFLQQDPYDQFACGYVGMGNDPGNLVDPTGGVVGCPAVAGLVGYGGAALSGASGASNAVSVLSTVAGLTGTAMRGGSLGNNIASQSNNINQSLQTGADYNSGSNSGGVNNGGNGGGETPGNGCPDCPKGYGPNPKPNGDQTPYFFKPNHAAKQWAFDNRDKAIAGPYEYSSLLFSVGTSTKIYAFTNPVKYPDDYDPRTKLAQSLQNRPYNWLNSPGVAEVEWHWHKWPDVSPPGAVLMGHIHMHPVRTKYGVHGANASFSGPDKTNNSANPKFYMYVLGALGDLHVNYPDNLKLEGRGNWPDPDAGKPIHIKSGYFNKDAAAPSDCKFFKQ